MKFKKLSALALTFIMTASVLVGCGGSKSNEVLNIYNVGDYIDEDLITKFEDETGIKVVYETYDTNEAMYQKLKSGSSNYDLIFPSDYMVEKLKDENMLNEIDYSNIPNYEKNMMDDFKTTKYDENNKYSVPYLWGTFGIVYNKTKVDEKDLKNWDILWNKKYEGQIQMLDSVRDTMGIALMKLGYSINTKEPKEIEEAKNLLIEQLPLVQAYVNDDGKDRLMAGDAAMGIYYSGDASVMIEENPDLAYYVPETGTNQWIDAMCIPTTAENKKEAEQFINFMLDAKNAAQNVEYIQYSTPNQAAFDLLSDKLKNDPNAYPSKKVLEKCQTFLNLPADTIKLYDDAWTQIKSQ